jgi:hypothetical protein
MVVMLDAVCRINRFLFDGARPIDRTILVVDLLVLLVIAAEAIRELRLARKARKRQKIIDERVQAVRKAISEGQRIHSSAVSIGHTGTAAWAQLALKWTADTQTLMASFSAQAEAAFLDVSEASPMNVHGSMGAAQEYSHLLARLKNLRGIMENPEVYL